MTTLANALTVISAHNVVSLDDDFTLSQEQLCALTDADVDAMVGSSTAGVDSEEDMRALVAAIETFDTDIDADGVWL